MSTLKNLYNFKVILNYPYLSCFVVQQSANQPTKKIFVGFIFCRLLFKYKINQYLTLWFE